MRRIILIVLLLMSVYCLWSKNYKIVYEEYPPFEFKENGVMKGLDIEILSAVAKKGNFTIEFVEVPWARALVMAEKGDCDGIISLFKTEERSKFLSYPTEGLGFEANVIFASANFKGDIKVVNELKGLTIGTVTEYSYGKDFDEYKGYVKEESKDQETMFKKLANNRVNLIITNELVGFYMLKSMNITNARKLSYVADNQPLYIGISKKSPNSAELYTLINNGLNDLKKSGELEKIRKKYKK